MFYKISSIPYLRKKLLPKLLKICVLCRQYHDDHDAVCSFCHDLLISIGPCDLTTPMVDRVITAYRYEEPLRTLLHSFKYHQGLHLTSFLMNLMLQAPFDAQQTDCLMPVPIHRKRLQQRGFNQAAVLAKQLSYRLGLPYVATGCKKVMNTTPQAGLDSEQRRLNLKGAFVAKHLPYTRITLIDDLYTTGSTANEIATTLKKQGVHQVDVWCCARAIKP